MPTLVYLHGFRSAPSSLKAKLTGAWLAEHHPDWTFYCPVLPANPKPTLALLDDLMAHQAEPLTLIGSSLGGFWATYLVERCEARAVLVNPAVRPARFAAELVGQPLKNYYTDDIYQLSDDCVACLRALSGTRPVKLDRYWLLAQTGDETLDYRDAVDFYQGARQTVIEGGNHSFEHFEQHLPDIFQFLTHR